MEEKNLSAEEMEELSLQLRKYLPTGWVIHKEIGVAWEVIAREVYSCSRNNVKQFADRLPPKFYEKNRKDVVEKTLKVWEDIIYHYDEYARGQKRRLEALKTRWKNNRKKYEFALRIKENFFYLTENEIRLIQTQIGDADFKPEYDGDCDLRDAMYDKIVENNKRELWKEIEPELMSLPLEQARRLAMFYDGYAAIGNVRLVAQMHSLSESNQAKLKQKIDSMSITLREALQRTPRMGRELADCYQILRYSDSKTRGGWETVSAIFEEKMKRARYLEALQMAYLIQELPVWELSKENLEMLMEFSFFLSDAEKSEVIKLAWELSCKDISFIWEELSDEELLENRLHLKHAGAVYDL